MIKTNCPIAGKPAHRWYPPPPTGSRVLAIGHLSETITWDLTDFNARRSDPRRAACERTGRGLNPDEWARYITGPGYEDTCSD